MGRPRYVQRHAPRVGNNGSTSAAAVPGSRHATPHPAPASAPHRQVKVVLPPADGGLSVLVAVDAEGGARRQQHVEQHAWRARGGGREGGWEGEGRGRHRMPPHRRAAPRRVSAGCAARQPPRPHCRPSATPGWRRTCAPQVARRAVGAPGDGAVGGNHLLPRRQHLGRDVVCGQRERGQQRARQAGDGAAATGARQAGSGRTRFARRRRPAYNTTLQHGHCLPPPSLTPMFATAELQQGS